MFIGNMSNTIEIKTESFGIVTATFKGRGWSVVANGQIETSARMEKKSSGMVVALDGIKWKRSDDSFSSGFRISDAVAAKMHEMSRPVERAAFGGRTQIWDGDKPTYI